MTFANGDEWRAWAACHEIGGDLWFPEDGQDFTAAVKVCRELCPVLSECLDYALRADERWGIWGGLTARQRKKLSRRFA